METLPQSLTTGAPLAPSHAPDTDTTEVVVEVQRPRGRPPRTSPTSGQMTLAGEVVEVVEADRRNSPWTEPTPELLTEADNLEMVTETAVEALDVDAELAELTPDADRHRFARTLTRGAMRAVAAESPGVRLTLVGHLLAIAWADGHAWSQEMVAELVGLSRKTVNESTPRLVELGLLTVQERGRISPTESRTSVVRPTRRLVELATEATACVTDAHTVEQVSSESVACVTDAHTGTCVTDAHTVESFRELPTRESNDKNSAVVRAAREILRAREALREESACVDCGGKGTLHLSDCRGSSPRARPSPGTSTTAPSKAAFVAEGSVCVDCGGEVTTDPFKPGTPPNPRCKPCHDKLPQKRPSGHSPSWDHSTASDYQYNPYGTPSVQPARGSTTSPPAHLAKDFDAAARRLRQLREDHES